MIITSNSILIGLGMISIILNFAIIAYSYKVYKIANYVNLWKKSWICFIIAIGITLIHRFLEIIDNGHITFSFMSFISSLAIASFFILFIYYITNVFKNITKLNTESRFMTLLKNLPAGVVIHDEDTSILYANSTAIKILDIKELEIQGLFANDKEWYFLREDGSPLPIEEYPVNRVLATNKSFSNEVYGVNHRKQTKWLLCNAYIVGNGERQVAVVFTDITDLKNMQIECKLSEELYKQAFMSSHDAIVISRMTDGKFYSVNKSFTILSGYSEKDIKGKTTIEINLWKNIEDRKYYIDTLNSKGFIRDYSSWFIRRDGTDFHGLVSGSSIMLNGEECVLTSVKQVCVRSHDERKEDKK